MITSVYCSEAPQWLMCCILSLRNISSLQGTLLKGVAHVFNRTEWNTQCGIDVAGKNRPIVSESYSQDCSKMSPIRGRSNHVEIMGLWSHGLFLSALICTFFFFFTTPETPHQTPCNTSTISKAIKSCSNSRTFKSFIRAVLSNRHLQGRLAVARVTLTNGNWRQEGRRNTRESQSCYA